MSATAFVDADQAACRPGGVVGRDIAVTLGERRVLDGVSLAAQPGQLLAVVGPSGGGKSTLLGVLGGTIPAEHGTVTIDGGSVGMVPQDDILHLELPLERTLVHAARLRLALPPEQVRAVVASALAELDLTEHAAVPVGRLSGGQRKRASVAVELLASPGLLLLDEPTAGLDPATAASLVRTLRRLADTGRTIIFTTHQIADLAVADAVAVLEGGRVAHLGDAATAIDMLGAAPDDEARPSAPAPARSVEHGCAEVTTSLVQWRALTRRNAEVLLRSPLTLAILLGAPLLVVAMFVVLFPTGAFDGASADAPMRTMVAYWLAFAGFFFGLTYGLLQICVERPVARRERFAGVGVVPYAAAKVAVLLPMLAVIDTTLLVVLQRLDRLPDDGFGATGALLGILLLDSAAALALGLLLSALVADVAQAALALPMVCFPAVLFAGAIVPVDDMATAGRMISVVTPVRWAFEAVAANLHTGPAGTPTSSASGAVALIVAFVALGTGLLAALRRRL